MTTSRNAQIRPEHLKRLRPLEAKLKAAVRAGSVSNATALMHEIQDLLSPYGHHSRLLECRLWYFESVLNANQVSIAESGFQGINKRANKGSRLYLESSFFVAVCLLRQKKVREAK